MLALLCALAVMVTGPAWSADSADDPLQFDDTPLDALLEHAGWFKDSFLVLEDDLAEAVAADKQGIIVYFGLRRCAYC